MIADRVCEISKLNDMFRQLGSGFMITPGIMELPDVCGLIGAVQRYDEFNEDSDPYGEHDFGIIEWNANDIFWKIDYCDPELKYFEDPLSKNCHRLLTVMRADEY